MHDSEIIRLLDEASDALNKEDIPRAIQLLTRLQENGVKDPTIPNNLATAYFMQGQYELAINALEENLADSVLNPFARALASQISSKMGEPVKAKSYLRDGIRQFEWGVRAPEKLMVSEKAWKEYTVVLKRAAGLLGDHRLVIDLHNRWEKHYQTEEDYYQVGIAFFNLGYFNRAASPWSRLREGGWNFIEVFIDTLELFDSKVLPAFKLEYQIPDIRNVSRSIEDFPWDKGVNRLFMLGISIFDDGLEHGNLIIQDVITRSGDWGRDAGLEMLKSNGIPINVKMGVGIALTEIGVFGKNEPIPMFIDGKETMVDILQGDPFEELSPDEENALKQAQTLAEAKQYQEALEIVNSLLDNKPVQIRLLVMAGKLYAVLDNEEKAKNIADQLYNMGKHENYFLVFATEIYTLLGDSENALNILDEIDEEQLPKELIPKLQLIEDTLIDPIRNEREDLAEQLQTIYINEELEKYLPKQKRLNTCLRNMPVQWLDGICIHYNIEPVGQRKEREKILLDHILNLEILKTEIKTLSNNAKELLDYLLLNHGQAFLKDLDSKFGDFMDENYWWAEDDFVTPIGELCRYGYAFVGTLTKDDGHEYGIIVPRELQSLLVK